MSNQILAGLLIASIPLSCIAILLSCISISVVVGLKNSTHRIEWKTLDMGKPGNEDSEEDEDDEEGMLETENPNRRRSKNVPFTPFPEEPKEEEPFFDENDPNIQSHDFQS